MTEIDWQGQRFAVSRLVVPREYDSEQTRVAVGLALGLGLEVAGSATPPRHGDLWLGCHPAGGWADLDPARVAWATPFEVSLAVHQLRTAAVPAHSAR